LKAGGVYLPLDPLYPRPHLTAMLADSGTRVVIATAATAAVLPDAGLELVDPWQDDLGHASLGSTRHPTVEATPGNLAYLIYTSGTTGRPRGVQVEHRAAAIYVRAASTYLRLTATDRLLQVASPSFDISLEEVLVTLTSGATLVLGSEEARISAPH